MKNLNSECKSKSGGVWACPSAPLGKGMSHIGTPLPPKETNDLSYFGSAVVLDRKSANIRRPSGVACIQEGPIRASYLKLEPQSVSGGKYTEWHEDLDTPEPEWPIKGENCSNMHFEGGNLAFVDGHAEYKKYRKLESKDFGLFSQADFSQSETWKSSNGGPYYADP